jgi:galactonate dehydratase
MRISDVRSVVLGDLHFVVLESESQLTGIGQSACWAYPGAVDAVVKAFRPALIGADARNIEHLHRLLTKMGPFRGSILSAAVSAVDIALWDLAGKALNVPTYQLLGGKCRDRVRLYCILTAASTEGLVAEARQAAEAGFTAVKVAPLAGESFDLSQASLVSSVVERVAAVRDAVGQQVDIIVELAARLTPAQALPVIEAVGRLHPLFVEDPIQVDSVQSQAVIASRVNVPMGQGERLDSLQEFRELLERGGAEYIRPDLGAAGGFTRVKKIAALAESYHAIVVTHNYFGPVLTAASATLDVCIPNFLVQEYVMRDESEIHHAFRSHWQREGGFLRTPDVPGIGIDFDETRFDPQDYVGYMGPRLYNVPRREDGSLAPAV